MITDPKTLADMGFNVATMTAFAIPVTGPEIAAGIAAGQMVFDIFFQVPNRIDPASIAPTHADLEDAINQLKQFIADAAFNTLLSSYQASILTISDQLSDVWSKVSTGNAVKDRARRGPLFQTNVSSAQLDSWRTEIDGYKKTILAPNPDLLQVINWIEGDVVHTNRLLGLYVLAGGLWVEFCNLNIGFEFILATHDYDDKLATYNTDLANFNLAHNVWKLSGKAKGDPEPLAPVAPVPPTKGDDFLNGSVFADKAKNYVDRFIYYAEPKIKALRINFVGRANALKTRLDAITLASDANGWHFCDAITQHTSRPTPYQQLADAHMQVYKGSIETHLWDKLTTDNGLDHIEAADVAALESSLSEWRVASTVFAPK